ncbi:MAG: hypothetical protein DCF15_05765 [Phormidesmis priestleyi]|uniref:Uncharacterized protein n=1 Tax=Phormidesmis priestleyi TaxID=268141 RepID=A0A2W4ZTU0_9CYAN|nr:MAG: hypothetical protein DCF15_05765 [Phormidesmis priestleyi]
MPINFQENSGATGSATGNDSTSIGGEGVDAGAGTGVATGEGTGTGEGMFVAGTVGDSAGNSVSGSAVGTVGDSVAETVIDPIDLGKLLTTMTDPIKMLTPTIPPKIKAFVTTQAMTKNC